MIYGARKPKCESSIEMRITTNIYTEANFRSYSYSCEKKRIIELNITVKDIVNVVVNGGNWQSKWN
ncbi:hypothetical protein DERF_008918 [Dermatophagoides farinae]|uniref:Uncharacterized protein n=1 Tax=Dermatophagoides farinae TaxID=6954 RepID=A0A922I5H1_DERFA|nr:hypothetical protein DERF_008918 [Dermatophagoides farinae]